MVPHAGYVYSGAIAGATFARVRMPGRVVIFGPNHHGVGAAAALYPGGRWLTPLGPVTVDAGIRITSYNVCYTKLLRGTNLSKPGESFSPGSANGVSPACCNSPFSVGGRRVPANASISARGGFLSRAAKSPHRASRCGSNSSSPDSRRSRWPVPGRFHGSTVGATASNPTRNNFV